MTYPEALAYLGETRRFGMKLGLDPMRELARALGNPQERLRFIHLAGTNGKGSTAAFCESCLRAAGYRVGLYTSPHLVSVRERIQVDRQPIPELAFVEGLQLLRGILTQPQDPPSTFFEIMTALALWYFEQQKVDWIVWETGLGGRLDATNIVSPELCIITNIGLDHQQYLGPSLEKIAAEKAGIIKPGVPVITAVEPGPAADVIRREARSCQSPLTVVPADFPVHDLGFRQGRQLARLQAEEYQLGLIGSHQVRNAACAVASLRQLPERIPAAAFTTGLAQTVWSGRFELISESPLIVLDGAHNPAGLRSLLETWRECLASRHLSAERTHLVFASVVDKDISEMAELLRLVAGRVSLVRLANERTSDPATLQTFFPGLPCTVYPSVADLWRARADFPLDEPVLITGSLFLVGEVLAQKDGNAGECQLNERLEKPLTR